MSNSYMLVGDEISVTGDSPASALKPDEEHKERGTGDDQGGDTAASKGQDDSPVPHQYWTQQSQRLGAMQRTLMLMHVRMSRH